MPKYTRQEIWRHNGALGQATMIRRCAESIAALPTTTGTARDLANQIANLAMSLQHSLKERR